MFERLVRERLAAADIVPGRGLPHDPYVTDPRFYRRVAVQGSLGLGESYMDGDWDCLDLAGFVQRVLVAGVAAPSGWHAWWSSVRESFRRAAHRSGAHLLGERHYSIGNDLYAAMLGPTMCYTCAWWPDAATLDEAQEQKMDLICRKLRLEQGMTMLDIGCGWGSLLIHAAKHYRVRGVGITVSREQAKLALERARGLPVHIHLSDYRDYTGQFDRVASIGMFEHVERAYHRRFMQAFHDCLAPGGIGLLHTIGKEEPTPPDPWIRKYIFPLGDIPTPDRIKRAAAGLLQERDWHRLGGWQYDWTLTSWFRNFERAWDRGIRERYGRRFYRMWRFYLLSCAGAFRADKLDVWQIVYTHNAGDTAIPLVR